MDELSGLSGASLEERLRSVGASIGLVALAFVSAVLLALAVARVAIAAGLPVRDDASLQTLILLPAQFIGFLIPLFAYLHVTDRMDLVHVRIPSLKDLGLAVAGIGALLVALIALNSIVTYLGISAANNSATEAARQNPEVIPIFVAMSILIVGPCEELLFRGGVQGLLREAYAPIPAILITSALFGVAHVAALVGQAVTGQLVYVAVAATLGVVLGIIYEYSENIIVPMLTHGIYNAILFGSLAVS